MKLTRTIWDQLPISWSTVLINSAKSLLPCKVTYSQARGLGHGHLWGGDILLTTRKGVFSVSVLIWL